MISSSSQLTRLLIWACLICALFIPVSSVAANLIVNPNSVPPGANVLLKGQGFGQKEPVLIYFDSSELYNLVTNTAGGFTVADVLIPRNPLPGPHVIKAVGQMSGKTAQANIAINTNWSQYGFDAAASGYNPSETVLSAANVAAIEYGGFTYNSRASIYATPVIVDGVVYIGTSLGPTNESALQAIDRNGKLVWLSKVKQANIVGLAASEGKVVVITSDGVVSVYKARNGKLLWSKKATNPIATDYGVASSPSISSGVIYFAGFSGEVLAYKLINGARLWVANLNHDEAGVTTAGRPIVVDDAVIFSTSTSISCPILMCGHVELNAVSSRNGSLRWTKEIPAWVTGVTATNHFIVLAGGYPGTSIQPGTRYGYLSALNSDNGEKIWDVRSDGKYYYNPPSIAENYVYASNGESLSAFEALSGSRVWTSEISGTETSRMINQKPIIANGVVYVNEKISQDHSASLWMLDANTGEVLHELRDINSDLPPIVVNGMVYTTNYYGWTFSWGITKPNNGQ